MNFLQDLYFRQRKAQIKKQAGFGIILGTILCLYGAWKYYLTITEYDLVWIFILALGFLLILIATICPAILAKTYYFFNKAADIIGKIIFSIMLGIIYFCLICPFGILAKIKISQNPFYYWDRASPGLKAVTWEGKTLDDQKYQYSHKKNYKFGFLVSLWGVFSFFLNKRHLFLIPSLILLIIIGIMFFFIQGSVLAPFIYTVF